jgi:hypothetical protein
MNEAEKILDRAVTEPVTQDLRSRVFELGEALFQSIRMQLSVEKYQAIAVGRGANLNTRLRSRSITARAAFLRLMSKRRNRRGGCAARSNCGRSKGEFWKKR